MRKYFSYDGTSCGEFGIYAGGFDTLGSTEREYDYISIPGKSGDLTLDRGRWKNQTITYHCGITSQFMAQFEAMRAFFMSHVGYYRLQDDFNAGQYRRAIFAGNIAPDVKQYARAGKFDLTFNCMPQRWLISGEEAVTFTAAGTIENPTRFNAKPLLRVTGAGSVGIGEEVITIDPNTFEYIEIDTETGDATYNATNANAYVSITGDTFPELTPGQNGITLNGVTELQIIPRWFTL